MPKIAMLIFPFLLALEARGATFEGTLRNADRTPIVGREVRLILQATSAFITSTTTNSAGYFNMTDAAAGVNRCVVLEIEPGYRWSSNFPYTDDAGETQCGTGNIDVGNPLFLFRRIVNEVHVVGGANGYVNPSRGESATIVIGRPGSSLSRTYVNLRIVNKKGKEIVSLERSVDGNALQIPIVWDGRDRNGQIVPSGIYYAYVSWENKRYTTKIAVVRN